MSIHSDALRAVANVNKINWMRIVIRGLLFVVSVIVVSFIIFILVGAWSITKIEETAGLFSRILNLPKVDRQSLANFPFIQSSRVLDRDGNEIGCYTKEYRIVVPLRDISPHLLEAIIASEDQRFRSHPGYDWIGITRAALSNVTSRRVVSGASTITQQVVKNYYLSPEKSLERKVKEIILAMQVEQKLTKDQILYLYVNMVYLGGPQGVEAASRTYFKKPAKDVTLAESAFIAGLIHRPGLMLKGEQGYRDIMRRKDHVLYLMVEHDMISKEEYQAATEEKIAPYMFSGSCEKTSPYITEEVRKKYRSTLPVLTGGLRFHTTIDTQIQRKAEEACQTQLNQYLLRHPEYRGHMQCSSVVVKIETGEILAMVGGQDFQDSEFNGATQSLRQPGSAFKPIVYAALLEQLVQRESQRRNAVMEVAGEIRQPNEQEKEPVHIPPYDPLIDCTVIDAPISVPMIVNHKGRVVSTHTIHNYPYTGRPQYRGQISCTLAVAESRNTAAIRAARQVTIDGMIEIAHRLGVQTPLQPYVTTALGASEVTLVELASAYLPFVNGGCKKELFLVNHITDAQGNTIEKYSHKNGCERVLSLEAAQGMRTILQEVVDNPLGTAHGLRSSFSSGAIAGKTGTATNANGDATDNWFIGATPRYLIASRINHRNKIPLGTKETGGRNALPVFTTIVRDLNLLDPEEHFPSAIFLGTKQQTLPHDIPENSDTGGDDEGVPPFEEIISIQKYDKPSAPASGGGVSVITPLYLPH